MPPETAIERAFCASTILETVNEEGILVGTMHKKPIHMLPRNKMRCRRLVQYYEPYNPM
jgi:hypothetical protein